MTGALAHGAGRGWLRLAARGFSRVNRKRGRLGYRSWPFHHSLLALAARHKRLTLSSGGRGGGCSE